MNLKLAFFKHNRNKHFAGRKEIHKNLLQQIQEKCKKSEMCHGVIPFRDLRFLPS